MLVLAFSFSLMKNRLNEAKTGNRSVWQNDNFLIAVTNPGFSRGGANPGQGPPTYYLANFPQKLHENNFGLEGARVPHAHSLDPPLGWRGLRCLIQIILH